MRTPEQNLNLALGFHRKGELGKAEKHYKFVLQKKPEDVTAQHLLGVIHYQKGHYRKSKGLIAKALKQAPNDPMILSNLGNSCQALGELDEAISLFDRALKLQPNNPQALANRGNAHRGKGTLSSAIRDYRAAIRLEPRLSEAARNLGISLHEERQYDEALPVLESCLKMTPNAPEAHLALANLCRDMGEWDRALGLYESAKGLGAAQADVDCEMGLALRDMGQIEKARDHLQGSVAANPNIGRAWRALVNLGRYYELDGLKRLKSARRKASNRADQMHMEFALGKVLDDKEEFPAAFGHYQAANDLHAQDFDYDVADDLAVFRQIRETFDSNLLEKFKGAASGSGRPIFIVGMPRSGTSLTEQIISAHSQVHGAGEIENLASAMSQVLTMPDGQNYATSLRRASVNDLSKIEKIYQAALDGICPPETPFVTDKLPMNFIRIGLIKILWPAAKIVHCRRNPVATCWSIYKNHLPANGHRYAANLSDLARYYNGYQELMAHWEALFPGEIIEVTYEKLVTDAQKQTENILSDLGLGAEQACFEPHKNKRAVRTLSASQVREPIYTGSVDSWRNYEAELAELVDVLNPV